MSNSNSEEYEYIYSCPICGYSYDGNAQCFCGGISITYDFIDKEQENENDAIEEPAIEEPAIEEQAIEEQENENEAIEEHAKKRKKIK